MSYPEPQGWHPIGDSGELKAVGRKSVPHPKCAFLRIRMGLLYSKQNCRLSLYSLLLIVAAALMDSFSGCRTTPSKGVAPM